MRRVNAWGASTSRPVVLEKVFGPQSSSSPPPLSTVVFAGPLGGAGCGAGVLGRDLDLSLAPAADDRPPSPLTTNLIIYMGFLSLTAGTGTGTGMVLVLDSECVTQNQNRQV